MTIPLRIAATQTLLILAATLTFTTNAFAASALPPATITTSPNHNVPDVKHKVLADKNQQIVTEARESLTGTQQALMALEKGDSKLARSLLETVSSKLAVILAKDPAMALVPAELEADIFDYQGDPATIKTAIKQADNFLDSGKLQNARSILAQLASEMQVTSVNIPLGSFPAAIKNAVSLIDAGKTNDAALVLDEVLNTLVQQTEIIPLPLLRAEALLTIASELEHKSDLSKADSRTEVLKFANAAKDKLKLAELLGYGNQDDYQDLYKAIDEIKEVIHSEKSATTWAKIKQSLADLGHKITKSKNQ
jgi:hypothetical protein